MPKKQLKTKVIKKSDEHVFQCDICWEMERRGYCSEEVYWGDVFGGKLKPVKYWLVKEKNEKQRSR